MKVFRIVSLVSLVCLASSAWAQTSEPKYWLDEVVVVADRSQTLLSESTWATSVLSSQTLNELPAKTLGDALRYVPGLTFVEKDGSGHVPMAIVRGFFGGGETEYILLTIDGVPVNDLRTGLIEWSQMPVSAIERIEVLRGGGSAVYGDAALGAVINIRTRQTASSRNGAVNIAFGQRGERSLSASNALRFGSHQMKLRASNNQADGFRRHSNWESSFVDGRYDFEANPSNSMYLQWSLARLKNDDPGPLMIDQIELDREQNNTLFDKDRRRRNKLDVTSGVQHYFHEKSAISADFGVRFLDHEQTRTLLVAPGFGDTQFLDERNLSLWSRLQYQHAMGRVSWLAGIDSEWGSYDSRYFDDDNRGSLNSEGEGDRVRAGLYLEARNQVTPRLRVTGGVRYDYIHDKHRADLNPHTSQNFKQLSPRFGVNYKYSRSEAYSGSVYANWTRSFKAPSLDQLFDERQVDSGVPGFLINISNDQLKPQRSKGFELGFYQKLPLVRNAITSELTVTAYRLDLDDEIDFDLATFKYGNILKSRHDGIEASLTLYFLPRFSLTSTVNYMDVTFRSGENDGNPLKNIPKEAVQNHMTVYASSVLELNFAHRYQSKVYLDDSNLITLAGHHTFDAQARVKASRFGVRLLIKNLANNHYNSSGFVLFDPQTFQNVSFLYPAEGRYFQTTVDFSF